MGHRLGTIGLIGDPTAPRGHLRPPGPGFIQPHQAQDPPRAPVVQAHPHLARVGVLDLARQRNQVLGVAG